VLLTNTLDIDAAADDVFRLINDDVEKVATCVPGAAITGKRLISGLRDTLLTSLNGGQGVGTLGLLQVTDRSGGSASVNLATAETLDDVIDLINASTANVTASINSARNGLLIADDSNGRACSR
jgi:flagellar hook-associated protein 2